jgi:small-conductance mechanosensitive channel
MPELVQKVWRYSPFTAQGTPVEVNQLVVAFLMLMVGLLVSRFLARRLRTYLTEAKQVDENSAAVLARVAFYVLLIIVIFSALQMVRIPITMFAFLGGAVAIGAGFGAQNIFNNFISGLILLTERPVRIGDLIEVGPDLGRVTEIGGRCTRIRRVDGVEMLLPNSTLLENNLVNRTLSDNLVRTSVSVGVAYGSPTRPVAEIIQGVVDRHPEVLEDPKPIVVFQDFGDNALVFEVYFWVEITQMMDLRRVRSDVRFGIDELFREAGVTIAFPQRDVHLDAARPLEVRLVEGADGR